MVNPEINLPIDFSKMPKFLDVEVKRLIWISSWISFLKINAPNIMGVVIVLAMIKDLV